MENPESLIPKDLTKKDTNPKPKHAVWITHMYPPENNAGAELMSHVLNLFLVKKGWKVTVLMSDFPHKSHEGVHVVKFKEKAEVEKALKEASVLVSHLAYSNLTVKIAKQLDLPIVLLIHNSFQIPYFRDFLKMIPPSQLHVIYNSYWIQRFYKPFDLDNRVLYPPIDSSKFNFPVRKGRYVTLINCTKDKGGDTLVKIARKMPDIQFLGVLGAYGKQIVEKSVPNLHYMKNTPNARLFYEESAIILMPSVYESWGRVAVESMSLGIPVIAHPTNGLKESLGEAGTFANRDIPDQWVIAIRTLITNPWLYERKCMEGLIRAKEVNSDEQLKDVEHWMSSLKYKGRVDV